MTNTEVIETIKEVENSILIRLMNDIYDYKYGTGVINKKSVLATYISVCNGNTDLVIYATIQEAIVRYEKIAKLLFINEPSHFIKL